MTRTLIVASLLFCSRLMGQVGPAADSAGTVTIVTEPSGADLYVDSVYIGKSPIDGIRIAAGFHAIRAFYPSVFAWNAVLTQASMTVLSGERVEKRLNVGEVVSIQSDPSGGIVRYEGRELGTTPLYARVPPPLAGDLMIEREGFDPLHVPLAEINKGMVRVKLRATNGVEGSVPGEALAEIGRSAADHGLTYVSGATMIVSGVASAYLKDRANRHFDAYSLTGDPTDLSRTRTLDRQAAATLIISEISFALLTYLLLSE